ncbi:hypothetical protein [Stutzerimonas kunmingensis]|uniref:hypothetical protein n=1 Tax=Stutzerimonas kunmingensis TaxID=1211807 RepID=UPI00241FAA76|nr:hypothetical protein [Stutzerimonas kunmingensis]
MARVLTKKSTVPGKVPLAADLEIGELAVNTADAKLFTKHSDNTIKQLGGDAASSFFSLVTVTATSAGQTSFTIPGGYTPGAVVVFLDGASLAPAHYTATNGTTVVLASGSGIVAGSVLLVHVLSAFEVADALPLGGTAADATRFGGQLPGHYATQADLAGVSPGPEFYQRSNILGTVSQSGGVPTGAIIERGSNANGGYVRFADGTQICRVVHVGGYTANISLTRDWPALFVGEVAAGGGPYPSATVDYQFILYGEPANWFFRSTSTSTNSVRVFGIGRWY